MASMLSLLDVLPRHEKVDVGEGKQIAVFGISGGDFGKILARYPDAFQQIASASGQPSRMDPGLLGALLAASQRNGESESLLGNDVVEQRGRSFAVGDQMAMLLALGRCTFPEGIGPFLESLVSMSSQTNEAMEVAVRIASREKATASPPMPKRSEPPDIPASGS